jgi:hypothetical protein
MAEIRAMSEIRAITVPEILSLRQKMGPPTPSPRNGCVSPHLGPGGTTLVCGGWGTQFRHRDRHSDTMYSIIPRYKTSKEQRDH